MGVALLAATASAADVEPWDGAARDAWIRASAEQAFSYAPTPVWTKLPALFVDPMPRSFSIGPALSAPGERELHLVHTQEGPPVRPAADGRIVSKPIDVVMRGSEQPIVVYLSSGKAVHWALHVEPEARLEAVYVSGPDGTTVTGLPDGISAREATRFADDFARQEGDRRVRGRNVEGSMLAGVPITTTQDDYSDEAAVVPPYRDASVVRDLLAAHRRLLAERTASPPMPYDVVQGVCILRRAEGGKNDAARILLRIADDIGLRAVTYSEVDRRYYGVSDQRAYVIDPETGHATQLEPPADYPQLSWLGGITYDPERKRIVITSLWHAGYHHLYDPVSKEWRVFPIDKTGGGLHAVAYSPTEKLIYGLVSGPGGRGLALYDSDLTFVRAVKTSSPETITPDHGGQTSTQLAILGRDAVVCTRPADSPRFLSEGWVSEGEPRPQRAPSACDVIRDPRSGGWRVAETSAMPPPLRCFLVSPSSGDVRLLTGSPLADS